ncbi:MAG: hypothetical protein FJ108_18545 [Deltaproteobacteria bacterium]|nr:hypothetical protein [Deltaproteobacteria bacterium]
MRIFLGVLAVLLNLADNATTFLCLRAPVPGFEVTEANPAAAWLFAAIGLEEGLVLEMVISALAIAFLVVTKRIPPRIKLALLVVLSLLPGWAALNNLEVIQAIDIPLSWS